MAIAQYIPNFLLPLQTVKSGWIDAPAASGGVAPPKFCATQKMLSTLVMLGQEQTNWCWSAVTQAVKQWAGQFATQSDVATAHIAHNGRRLTCSRPNDSVYNGSDCAADDRCAAICNDPHILSVVLKEHGHLVRLLSQYAPPSFEDIVSRINVDKPIPCRVQWSTGGGHFILVVGWTIDSNGMQLVHVLDPGSVPPSVPVPQRVLTYDQFARAYTLSGVLGAINYSYEIRM